MLTGVPGVRALAADTMSRSGVCGVLTGAHFWRRLARTRVYRSTAAAQAPCLPARPGELATFGHLRRALCPGARRRCCVAGGGAVRIPAA